MLTYIGIHYLLAPAMLSPHSLERHTDIVPDTAERAVASAHVSRGHQARSMAAYASLSESTDTRFSDRIYRSRDILFIIAASMEAL